MTGKQTLNKRLIIHSEIIFLYIHPQSLYGSLNSLLRTGQGSLSIARISTVVDHYVLRNFGCHMAVTTEHSRYLMPTIHGGFIYIFADAIDWQRLVLVTDFSCL